jgi:hypothetical protein
MVYARWKWSVRLGLMVVPFLVFLSEGLILFLTPSKYRSTTLFEFENGPPLHEIPELIVSRSNLERVAKQLELSNRFGTDRDTSIEVIRKNSKCKVMSDTRLVEFSMSHTNANVARDIAEQMPLGLKIMLEENIRRKNEEKAVAIKDLISEAEYKVSEVSTDLHNVVTFHGMHPTDGIGQIEVERARRAMLLAEAEVEHLDNQRLMVLGGRFDTLPRLVVHSAPTIASAPHSPNIGVELAALTVRSLVIGLFTALLLPYLLELAFPPHRQAVVMMRDPVEDL